MFRMIGYGENIGSVFPSILKIWQEKRWAEPELTERQDLNEVHLMLKIALDTQSSDNMESSSKSSENGPETVRKPTRNRPETSQKTSRKISAKQQAILAYLRANPLATRKKLTENIEGLSWASSKYQLAQLKKLDFNVKRGTMAAFLTDGREVIVPVKMFPEIKNLSKKQREDYMIMDDQYFSFEAISKIFSVKDILRI